MSLMKHESHTIFCTTYTLDASELLQAGAVNVYPQAPPTFVKPTTASQGYLKAMLYTRILSGGPR